MAHQMPSKTKKMLKNKNTYYGSKENNFLPFVIWKLILFSKPKFQDINWESRFIPSLKSYVQKPEYPINLTFIQKKICN